MLCNGCDDDSVKLVYNVLERLGASGKMRAKCSLFVI